MWLFYGGEPLTHRIKMYRYTFKGNDSVQWILPSNGELLLKGRICLVKSTNSSRVSYAEGIYSPGSVKISPFAPKPLRFIGKLRTTYGLKLWKGKTWKIVTQKKLIGSAGLAFFQSMLTLIYWYVVGIISNRKICYMFYQNLWNRNTQLADVYTTHL